MHKIKYILTLLLLWHLGCETGPEKIARVGALDITVAEFKSSLQDRYPHKNDFRDINFAQKKEILNNLIRRELKLNAAYDTGLQEDEKITAAVREYEEKLIIARYHEKMVIDVLVPARAVADFIENQRYEIKASHILITYREVNPKATRSMEEAQKLAAEVHQRLIEGADFAQMAREYSDDTATRNTGGELSYFTRGTMVPEFEDPLWQLDIGGISQPVKSRYGYHIIRLDDKRERENYSAPEDEEEIFYVKRQLFMAHGDSGRIVWDRQLENLKKTYGFELEKQNILNIATVITQKFYQGETGYDTFSDDQLNMTLASWRGGGLTVRDMFSSEPDRLNRLLVRYKQAQFVEQDVTSEGVRRLILADARAMGIGRDPYILELVDNFRNMQLLQEIEKREVSDKSEASLEEAKAYYDANPEKFQQPAEIELWEIFVSDEAQARDLAERARNGENFEKLARNFSQDKKYRAKSGYLGYLSSGARGLITREAFSLGPGQKIGGPLKYRNGWVIFMTGRKKEATLRPFEDVDNRARSLIKRERLEERRRVWEDSLRSAYTVEVDTIKMKEV